MTKVSLLVQANRAAIMLLRWLALCPYLAMRSGVVCRQEVNVQRVCVCPPSSTPYSVFRIPYPVYSFTRATRLAAHSIPSGCLPLILPISFFLHMRIKYIDICIYIYISIKCILKYPLFLHMLNSHIFGRFHRCSCRSSLLIRCSFSLSIHQSIDMPTYLFLSLSLSLSRPLSLSFALLPTEF